MNEVINKNQYDENGDKHGYWEEYYFTGKLWYKGNYNNGKKHGYWESYYYFTGNLWSKGNYNNGKKHGYWEDYTNGKKKCETYYL